MSGTPPAAGGASPPGPRTASGRGAPGPASPLPARRCRGRPTAATGRAHRRSGSRAAGDARRRAPCARPPPSGSRRRLMGRLLRRLLFLFALALHGGIGEAALDLLLFLLARALH